MAKKKTESAPLDTNPATNDAFTGMLAISMVALIVGSVLLYLDFSQYPDPGIAPKTHKGLYTSQPVGPIADVPKADLPKAELPPKIEPKIEEKVDDKEKKEEKASQSRNQPQPLLANLFEASAEPSYNASILRRDLAGISVSISSTRQT